MKYDQVDKQISSKIFNEAVCPYCHGDGCKECNNAGHIFYQYPSSRRKYNLSSSLTDRVSFDEAIEQYTEFKLEALTVSEIAEIDTEDFIEDICESLLNETCTDDTSEAYARCMYTARRTTKSAIKALKEEANE